jgi:small subunit ribosomal protein S9
MTDEKPDTPEEDPRAAETPDTPEEEPRAAATPDTPDEAPLAAETPDTPEEAPLAAEALYPPDEPLSAAETPDEVQQEKEVAEATAAEPVIEADVVEIEPADEEFVEESPRVKPEIPGMDLEVDIVREGDEALREDEEDIYGDGEAESAEEEFTQPIADAAIDLAAGARYTATGKRKTAVARVILKPGNGSYEINGRTLDVFFPRPALQRTIRTALETVGLEEKIDVVAAMHGGGVAAQAGALRHAISKALVDADPNLRSELKRRGFLTRDARVKERKKAGLKKARKRPQFSKR